jgi:hypothetical protein
VRWALLPMAIRAEGMSRPARLELIEVVFEQARSCSSACPRRGQRRGLPSEPVRSRLARKLSRDVRHADAADQRQELVHRAIQGDMVSSHGARARALELALVRDALRMAAEYSAQQWEVGILGECGGCDLGDAALHDRSVSTPALRREARSGGRCPYDGGRVRHLPAPDQSSNGQCARVEWQMVLCLLVSAALEASMFDIPLYI